MNQFKLTTYLLIVIFVSCLGFTNSVLAHGNDLDNEAAKTVLAFHHALKSGDKKTARMLLADDVLIFEGGGVERSADQYANHHMLADMKYLAAVDTKILEHTVNVSGRFAVSMSRSKTTGKYKGKDRNVEGMETMTLKEVNGEWKITHIHWSN
ncbi:MAG: nuclear transport factor 2 family protein [Colwellia sp.]|nr:nuclear transport factor 2 family protein [Colwellia sp.]